MTFATSIVKVKGRKPTRYFTLNIGGNVATKADLEAGDLVRLEIDKETGKGRISPTDSHDDGWILSETKESKLGLKVVKLRFIWKKGLPLFEGKEECSNVQAVPGELIFTFPPGTRFDGEQPVAEFREEERRSPPEDQRNGERREIKFGRRSTDRVITAELCSQCGWTKIRSGETEP